MGDFGKLFGDDMSDSDMAMLDGMGMGGEFTADTADVDMSEMEAEATIDEALDDDDAFAGLSL